MALYFLGYTAVAAVVYFALALRAPRIEESADFLTGPAPRTAEVIELFTTPSDRLAA
jgi:hypothetical protein